MPRDQNKESARRMNVYLKINARIPHRPQPIKYQWNELMKFTINLIEPNCGRK